MRLTLTAKKGQRQDTWKGSMQSNYFVGEQTIDPKGFRLVYVYQLGHTIKTPILEANLKVFRHVHWAMHKDVAVERRLDGDHRLLRGAIAREVRR